MNLKVVSVLLIVFFAANKAGFANETKKDSLENALLTTEKDSVKVQILLQLASISEISDRENSVGYFTRALQLETREQQKAEILNSIGRHYLRDGNYTEALEYFKGAIDVFLQQPDSAWLGRIYNNIAVANYWLGNSLEALTYYQNSLAIREKLDDKTGVSRVLNNIGMIYQEWNLNKDALFWHESALKTANEINNSDLLAYCYSNIGKCYENLENYELALVNYRKGHQHLIKKEEHNQPGSFFSYFFGGVYSRMNQLDSALFHYQKSLEYANRINNKNRIAIAYFNLGKTHLGLNEIAAAKEYLSNSYASAIKNNYKSLERDNLFLLSEIAEKQGEVNRAFRYLKQAQSLSDSLFSRDKLSKFTELQIKYYTEKQNQENLLLRKNNEINQITIRQEKLKTRILVAGGIFIFGIMIIIALSRRSYKILSEKLEKSERELQKVNADKNKFFTLIAHDLKSPFNGLLGITELLADNFDEFSSEQAKNMMRELKKSTFNLYALVEGLLQWAQVQTEKISYHFEKTDLADLSLTTASQLHASAKNKNITVRQNIQKNTFVYVDVKSVSTVLRNLISNAIKYSHPGGIIEIDAIEKDDLIEVSVTDNGIGMDEHTIQKLFSIAEKVSSPGTVKETGTGLGLIICKEFVEKNNGVISVKSEPGKGSRFSFTLPVPN